ncbi:MAG TPA: BatA domain-containing protein, partial [Anaeromyxobacteraceae bacterium]|nr:BatA domain-containing protein [Anaeromyxobacteraceae bacterium]
MSLGFLNPALLWGLLAAAIPLVIHLFFRRRPKPVPFPAIDFVLRARKQAEQRLRLKKVLLFTARTLLLAAAALAIARPRAERPVAAAAGAGGGPQATVIVLDASASMQYRLGGQPLFARARADALAALTSLSGEEPAAALVCDGRPPAAAAPSFDKAAVRRILDEAEVASGH